MVDCTVQSRRIIRWIPHNVYCCVYFWIHLVGRSLNTSLFAFLISYVFVFVKEKHSVEVLQRLCVVSKYSLGAWKLNISSLFVFIFHAKYFLEYRIWSVFSASRCNRKKRRLGGPHWIHFLLSCSFFRFSTFSRTSCLRAPKKKDYSVYEWWFENEIQISGASFQNLEKSDRKWC